MKQSALLFFLIFSCWMNVHYAGAAIGTNGGTEGNAPGADGADAPGGGTTPDDADAPGDETPDGADAPGGDAPGSDGTAGGSDAAGNLDTNTVNANGNVNADGVSGGIDINALQCLCNLQISADSNGNAGVSADGDGGDCGFDPLPKLVVDCSAILSGSVSGAFFYYFEMERSGVLAGYGVLRLDAGDGYEIANITWMDPMDADNPLVVSLAELQYGPRSQSKVWEETDNYGDDFNLCENNFDPGTYEYIILEITKDMVTNGNGCPIKKWDKTQIPTKLPPAIYQFPEMLPCVKLSFDVETKNKKGYGAFEIWYDFEPTVNCYPLDSMA